VLVLYGDVPLMQSATLQRLVGTAGGRALALLTVQVDDATGYGRILRDASDHITGIVEHADATDSQRAIREINTGLLCAPAALLRGWLARLDNDNAQGEYYLKIGRASCRERVAGCVRTRTHKTAYEIET